MRWPWSRRRNKGGRVVFIGTSPFDVQQAIAAVPTASPVVSAWIPEAQAPPPPPPPAAPVAPLDTLNDLAAELAELAASAAVPEMPGMPEMREESRQEPRHVQREEPGPGVQLGFADGTTITLADDDPRAVALRAAAARLTGTG